MKNTVSIVKTAFENSFLGLEKRYILKGFPKGFPTGTECQAINALDPENTLCKKETVRTTVKSHQKLDSLQKKVGKKSVSSQEKNAWIKSAPGSKAAQAALVKNFPGQFPQYEQNQNLGKIPQTPSTVTRYPQPKNTFDFDKAAADLLSKNTPQKKPAPRPKKGVRRSRPRASMVRHAANNALDVTKKVPTKALLLKAKAGNTTLASILSKLDINNATYDKHSGKISITRLDNNGNTAIVFQTEKKLAMDNTKLKSILGTN